MGYSFFEIGSRENSMSTLKEQNEPYTKTRSVFFRVQAFYKLYFLYHRFRDHILKDDLQRHSMAATPSCLEKITVALPFPVLELNGMGIIFSLESH